MSDSAWVQHSVDRPWPDGFTFNNFTRLPWDSPEYFTPGMYDPADNTRLTCVNDGVHIVLAQASWRGSSLGSDFGIAIRKNGGSFRAEFQSGMNGKFWPAIQCVAVNKCVAGDFFQVHVGQKTGATQTLGSDGSWFTIARIPDSGAGGLSAQEVRAIVREELAAALFDVVVTFP